MPAYRPDAFEEAPVEAPPEDVLDEPLPDASTPAGGSQALSDEAAVSEDAPAVPEAEAESIEPGGDSAEEPAQEECDEATFFIEQSLFDEASEILETVLIAYPGHKRATELMAKLEEARGSGGA